MRHNILSLLLLLVIIPIVATSCDDDEINEEYIKVKTNQIAINGEVFSLPDAQIVGDSLFMCSDKLGRNVQFVIMRSDLDSLFPEPIGKKYILSHHDGSIALTDLHAVIMNVNLLLGEYDSKFRLENCRRLNFERTSDYKVKIEILKGHFSRVPDGKTYLTNEIFVDNCQLEFNINPLDPEVL